MKTTVLQRLNNARRWCQQHGAPYAWLDTLLFDAAQELESQSGALWCQWMTSRTSHVRVFVTGEMGQNELDSFMEFLKLARSSCREERREQPPSADAVREDVEATTE